MGQAARVAPMIESICATSWRDDHLTLPPGYLSTLTQPDCSGSGRVLPSAATGEFADRGEPHARMAEAVADRFV